MKITNIVSGDEIERISFELFNDRIVERVKNKHWIVTDNHARDRHERTLYMIENDYGALHITVNSRKVWVDWILLLITDYVYVEFYNIVMGEVEFIKITNNFEIFEKILKWEEIDNV